MTDGFVKSIRTSHGRTTNALGRDTMRQSGVPWWKDDPPRAQQLDVVFASTSQAPTQKTGLVCPLCKEAYGAIEDQQSQRIVFKCQGCGHRWHWDDPWPERS